MSPEPLVARTVTEMYTKRDLDRDAVAGLLDTSLQPRGPELLVELAANLGLGAGHSVLDVGCRAGAHLVELHERTGCAGVGLEPVTDNLVRRSPSLADRPVTFAQGLAQHLPFADATFDLAWARDTLCHIGPLVEALRECRRVLRPGAPMLVCHVVATPLLEPAEAKRLWPALAIVPANTDRGYFEHAVTEAGFRIKHRDELTSEWREHAEEHGADRAGRQLLWAARLLRRPDHYRSLLGEIGYTGELANCLWAVFHMIGKLTPVVYVLRT